MKTFRKISAAPFLGIGLAFLAIWALIADEHIDLLPRDRPVH
jgi:hypothetical protein